jgi:hypothetical protein
MFVKIFPINDMCPFFNGRMSMFTEKNGRHIIYSDELPKFKEPYAWVEIKFPGAPVVSHLLEVKRSFNGMIEGVLLSEMHILDMHGDLILKPRILRYTTSIGRVELLYVGSTDLIEGELYIVSYNGCRYIYEVEHVKRVNAEMLTYGRIYGGFHD